MLKTTGKPKKVGQDDHRPRTKLRPAKVRLLSAEQVRRIIDSADVDGNISDEFVTMLRVKINEAQKWLKPEE